MTNREKILFAGIILVLFTGAFTEEEITTRPRYLSRRRYRTSTESSDVEKTTEEIPTTTPTTESPTVIALKEFLKESAGCGINNISNTEPWITVIEHTDPSNSDTRKTLSKGVLINDRHVLTTVSSIHNSHPFWVVSGVRLGDAITWVNDKSERNDSDFVRVGVDTVFQHNKKDIAVIRLSEKVNFTNYINSICLPIDENYNFRELYQHRCKRVNENGRKFLVETLPCQPLTPQDCGMLFQRKGAEFSSEEFCAWDQFGDTCTGDIGGPLMTHFNGRSLVVGLSSYAVGSEEFDADDYPGVYVRVGKFLKWIKDILAFKDSNKDE